MHLPTLFSFPDAAYHRALTTLLSSSSPSALSIGCGLQPPSHVIPGAPSTNIDLFSPLSSPNTTLQHRRYRIHLPENYPVSNDDPRPLLLTFNGQFQSTASIENLTRFSNPEFNPNAIVVYAEGIINQWLGDAAAPPSSYINDVQFVSDVLDDVESKLCIDTKRVYGAGLSNGGGLTGLLACNLSVGGRFAALAGVSAAYYRDNELTEPIFGANCGSGEYADLPVGDGNRRTPYLEIHGEEDVVIDYDGDNTPDPSTYPLPVFLSRIAGLNGCNADSTWPGVPGIIGVEANATQILNNGNITKYRWTCNGNEDVVLHLTVKGLGHGWPSTSPVEATLEEYRLSPTNWNANRLIGEWFGKWSR